MSPGGNRVGQVWPKCHHPKGNCFLCWEFYLLCFGCSKRPHLHGQGLSVAPESVPEGPQRQLEPWMGCEFGNLWVTAPSGGCSCFPSSSEHPWSGWRCWPSTSLARRQGPFSIPASPAPPHCTCFILCLFPLTLNQFCQLLNYFNFSSFSKSLKYILYIGYRLKKESYRCALASEILPEKCEYFISAFHFSRHVLL